MFDEIEYGVLFFLGPVDAYTEKARGGIHLVDPEGNGKDLIVFKGVCKTYPMGELEVRALRNVDLSIKEGELIVILGPSGSGKTTLLNLIGGMDTISDGKLTVNGQDISHLDGKGLTDYRRTQIGFIFQFFNLIPTLTALENVEFALELVENDTRDKSMQALEMVGLAERSDHFPSQLSGGEQQRVAIARAICKRPPILLCDEPTGELDYETGKNVLKVMQDINRREKQTIILVTHNSAIAEMSDRTVRLHSGEVAEITRIEGPKEAEELVW
jgi:putative ABC transport system ATP-binding protein